MTSDVNLTGVPETMLWTLHNRASEALRPDAILDDELAVRIYRSIDYDFRRSFGKPDFSHGLRSRVFDDALRPWLTTHRGGTVVELGAGLETQFYRVDDGQVRWLCVDLPEAITVREQFLDPTERCRHLAVSALDESWINAVDSSRGVFVSAQGLFMYFDEAQVRQLVTAMTDRLAGMRLMFDAIPPWLSAKSAKGWNKTKHYRTPPMPWGVKRDDIAPLLRSWSQHVDSVEHVSFGYRRGPFAPVLSIANRVSTLANLLPSIVSVTTTVRR